MVDEFAFLLKIDQRVMDFLAIVKRAWEEPDNGYYKNYASLVCR